jgi:hypothetical protein
MWRDELQAWLIARDTASWSDFLQAMRYEGTPPLWHALLRLISLFQPVAMQVLHFAIGLALAFILLRFSPFRMPTRVLLCFGYYIFYQYMVVSRHYSLGLLCLTGACALFVERAKRPIAFATALCLAALTSAPALLVAAGIACAAAWDTFESQPDGPARRLRLTDFSPPLLYLVAAAISWKLMSPAPDTLFPSSPGWFFHFHPMRLQQTLEVAAKAFFPTPAPRFHFWEMPWIALWPGFRFWGSALGMALLIAGGWSCRNQRPALVAYSVGAVGLLLFYYCKYLGFSRHHGFLFFNLIFAFWLADGSQRLSRRAEASLVALLVFQVAGSVIAGTIDARNNFSSGKSVANYLRANGLAQEQLAFGPDYLGVPVVGYLGGTFYSAQGDREQSFTRWDMRRLEMFDDREFIKRAKAQAHRTGRGLVMLINYPMDPTIARESHATELTRITGAVLSDEDYFVYRIPMGSR